MKLPSSTEVYLVNDPTTLFTGKLVRVGQRIDELVDDCGRLVFNQCNRVCETCCIHVDFSSSRSQTALPTIFSYRITVRKTPTANVMPYAHFLELLRVKGRNRFADIILWLINSERASWLKLSTLVNTVNNFGGRRNVKPSRWTDIHVLRLRVAIAVPKKDRSADG
jgi:hypothetical protein